MRLTLVGILLIVIFGFVGLYLFFIREGTGSAPSLPTQIPADGNSSPPVQDSSAPLQMFLIALEDGGAMGKEIGCGDSLIGVVQGASGENSIRVAYDTLFSEKARIQPETGYYNALYQSDLQVEDIKIENAVAQVYLTGELILGGVCDSPRVQAQLEETALQFDNVDSVTVFVNGTSLEDVLGG